MKTLTMLICLILSFGANLRVDNLNDNGAPGHLPFDHSHSSTCYGGSTGVCFGYAMGRAAGAGLINGKYPACDPATMIPKNCPDQEDWDIWSVEETNYWDFFPDATLYNGGNTIPSGVIIKFSGGSHVSYLTSGINSTATSATLDHIPNAGGTPTNHTMYKQPNGSWKLVMNGSPYDVVGFYRSKQFNVKAQNRFYNGPTTSVTNQGSITIANETGTSPKTVAKGWSTPYSATALAEHNWPTGYKQIFDNQWTKNGLNDGTTLTIPVEVTPSLKTYEAQYYQGAGVTFTPVGGGGITVDGQTRYTPYTKYVQVNPPPAGQASATAVGTTVDRIEYQFTHWTNSANSNVLYTSSISFAPTAAVTYTAHFSATPQIPANIAFGGTVGSPIQITWTEHPNPYVDYYQIWRKLKPQGGQTGTPVHIGTVNRGTTSYSDWDYVLTNGYTDAMIWYDVRSHFSVNNTYSQPSWHLVYGEEGWVKLNDQNNGDLAFVGAELPTEFAVSSYPNPFNPSTTISYSLVEDANVTLTIYDMMGREVATLVRGDKSAGYHSAQWNGKDANSTSVATGAYIYRLVATPQSNKQPIVISGKLLLAK